MSISNYLMTKLAMAQEARSLALQTERERAAREAALQRANMAYLQSLIGAGTNLATTVPGVISDIAAQQGQAGIDEALAGVTAGETVDENGAPIQPVQPAGGVAAAALAKPAKTRISAEEFYKDKGRLPTESEKESGIFNELPPDVEQEMQRLIAEEEKTKSAEADAELEKQLKLGITPRGAPSQDVEGQLPPAMSDIDRALLTYGINKPPEPEMPPGPRAIESGAKPVDIKLGDFPGRAGKVNLNLPKGGGGYTPPDSRFRDINLGDYPGGGSVDLRLKRGKEPTPEIPGAAITPPAPSTVPSPTGINAVPIIQQLRKGAAPVVPYPTAAPTEAPLQINYSPPPRDDTQRDAVAATTAAAPPAQQAAQQAPVLDSEKEAAAAEQETSDVVSPYDKAREEFRKRIGEYKKPTYKEKEEALAKKYVDDVWKNQPQGNPILNFLSYGQYNNKLAQSRRLAERLVAKEIRGMRAEDEKVAYTRYIQNAKLEVEQLAIAQKEINDKRKSELNLNSRSFSGDKPLEKMNNFAEVHDAIADVEETTRKLLANKEQFPGGANNALKVVKDFAALANPTPEERKSLIDQFNASLAGVGIQEGVQVSAAAPQIKVLEEMNKKLQLLAQTDTQREWNGRVMLAIQKMAKQREDGKVTDSDLKFYLDSLIPTDTQTAGQILRSINHLKLANARSQNRWYKIYNKVNPDGFAFDLLSPEGFTEDEIAAATALGFSNFTPVRTAPQPATPISPRTRAKGEALVNKALGGAGSGTAGVFPK